MKNVLILFGCASHRQGPRAIAQAHELGLETILIDTPENLHHLAIKAPQQIPVYPIVSKQYEDCLPLLEEICARYPVIGIYTFEEYSVETCARLCEKFGFANNTTAAVQQIRNKSLCRQMLARQGLPQPLSCLFSNLAQAEHFLHAHPAEDWILKPVDASGSQGVSRIRNSARQDLHTAYACLTERQQQSFIIEQFIEGTEFSLEGFFHYGEAIFQGVTEKSLKPGGAFVEDMHLFPATLPPDTQNRVYECAEKALRCVGLTFGHFHLEFWLAGEHIIMGEMHCRPGGDYIHLLTETATRIPTYAAVFQQYLPTQTPPKSPPEIAYFCTAVVKYFDAPEGRLVAIDGLEDVRQNDDIVLAEMTVKPGDIIPLCTDSGKRVGCVVVSQEKGNNARQTAMEMAAHVQFDVI
ncbi:ATP-grasp domain-containing protein [Serratia sp. PAMC26656]|uniref:ATP-grasp domain-containing protein n=1 Tax=Serratia sp. PAMC26656 TaxID=2775909 RepID=UPI0018F7AE41|nr:ATP-grasp domain-containing protein [Serratia sp. PAMC26656]MBJ7889999.1 ATP-grasp domain-containing protein [Serratia sp. PAMC26656]